ncbi:MAG: hypothetical protein WDM76_09790, partial [Limisphaerales bacterium]
MARTAQAWPIQPPPCKIASIPPVAKPYGCPPGTYKITAQIYLPSNTTLVGDPILYTNVTRRIVLWA